MNADRLLKEIAQENNFELQSFSALAGGDINEVFLLNTNSGKIVAKLNDAQKFPGMFEAEAAGLMELAKPNYFQIPEVINTGEVFNTAYILLEYIASSPKSSDFDKSFGENLAGLHKITSEEFGFGQDNYIGSLPQRNNAHKTASEFYINERLQPQLKLAQINGFTLHVTEKFFSNISELVPNETPSLIHGDLWNGNFLVNSKGLPSLIDPATAYAPREMDLAMMKLFGGFNDEIFEIYNAHFPLEVNFEERLPLWQLYYLLVHLNLFGSGYLNPVTSIIKKFN